MLESLSNSDELDLSGKAEPSVPQLPSSPEPTLGAITSANILDSNNSEENLKSWRDVAEYVALPGAVGGITRFLWEVVDPEVRPSYVQLSDTPVSDYPSYPSCASVYCRAPIYTTMGVIGAVIGTILLANFIRLDSSKNHRQCFQLAALSIVFGLFFSNVLSLAKEQLPELTDGQKINQWQRTALNDTPNDKNNDKPIDKNKAITMIEDIAQSTANTEVDSEAIQSITIIARNADDPDVDITAIQSIYVIVQDSNDTDLDRKALQSIYSIARDNTTNTKVLRTTLEVLHQLATSSDGDDFLKAIVQTINNIIQGIPETPEDPSQEQSFEELKEYAHSILEEIS